ncbi:MAG: AMP-dependent synthetase/ligase [Flaviflexus sp.]|nr:AMP-dependent synthetase/ligase [Flaviflexus sp.]
MAADRPVSYVEGTHQVPDDMNLATMLKERVDECPDEVVIERKSSLGSHWVPITYRHFDEHVAALAKGFIHLGVKPGDRVALMSRTRYEWALIDFALAYAGAQSVPIYETSSRSQAEWILSDSGARFVIVENTALRDLISPLCEKIDTLEDMFVIESGDLDTLITKGAGVADDEIATRIENTTADDPATIIYTSGTTGRPKGCVLAHRQLLHVVLNGPNHPTLKPIIMKTQGGQQRTLLFMPMAHVFARFINIVAIYGGATIGHSPDTKNLLADIDSFKPTFVLAVPRVFEKIYNAADAKAGVSPVKRRLFRYYAKVAITYSRALQTEEGPSAWLTAQRKIGDRLVYAKLRSVLGGKLKYVVSGGGPLGERLGHYFRGIGINILEGYGLTETSAPTCVNRPDAIKIGTIGQAYPGCMVSVAEDGEILAKGDHVFKYYLNNEEATKEAFTPDGWFRTGDLGSIDDDGFVTVTGRKKELIVTAGGKNVAPAVLEDRLRGHPLVSQVVVVGDNRPFIGALVTIDADMLPAWLKSHNLPAMSVEEAAENPQVLAALDRAVTRANEVVSRAESIRKIRVLTTDFTVDNNYLTPSMKVKRHEVLKDFASDIDQIYAAKR